MADNAVLHDILEKIETKEKEGENGDMGWMQLIVLKAVYYKVVSTEENPMVRFGDLLKSHPKLGWLSLIGIWIAIALSVALFIVKFFNVFGIAIVALP